MLRRGLLALMAVAGLTFGLAPAVASASAPEVAPVEAVATTTVACQQTFHARPTKGGLFSDPCSFNTGQTTQYSWSIGLKWHWDCTGGCHINAVLAALTICHFADPNTTSISTDAVSINMAQDKSTAFLVFAPGGGQHVDGCDTLTSPFLQPVKGCGSNDGHLIGSYPGIVSLIGRGRGTLYGTPGSPSPDWQRIPAPGDFGGYFETHESYYWVGRGGVCGS